MTVIERLRVLVGVVGFYDDAEEYGDEWYPELENRIPDELGTVRPLRFASVVLKRIEEAGAALSLDHALKRMYSSFRSSLVPLVTPLRSLVKSSGRSVPWGGSGVYFDVVTKPYQQPHVRSKFWRDPFLAAS